MECEKIVEHSALIVQKVRLWEEEPAGTEEDDRLPAVTWDLVLCGSL